MLIKTSYLIFVLFKHVLMFYKLSLLVLLLLLMIISVRMKLCYLDFMDEMWWSFRQMSDFELHCHS